MSEQTELIREAAMSEQTLTQQVADLRDADIVEARLGDATVKGPVSTLSSGTVLVAAGNQSIYLSYRGSADGCLTEIVSVTRPKRRIKRGDVIDSETDLDSLEIPPKTAVRDQRGDVWYIGNGMGDYKLVELFGPARVIDVPGEDDES